MEFNIESRPMSPILCYMQADELPLDKGKARRIRKQDAKKNVLLGKLNKMVRASLMLHCLVKHETSLVLAKVHKGAYK